LHNRGIMLYGPPGNGKTSLMNQVADLITGRGDVVFYAKSISALIEGLGAFREVEPDRKTVVVLEDADEYVGWQEREFLQLLDGEKSIDGVLYLGSTNYINAFPPRLLRPGRFDKRIYVGPPPYEGRLAYLSAKLAKMEKTAEIERLAKNTDGLSFGDLRELVTAVYALKENPDAVINRLKTSANRKHATFAKVARKSIGDEQQPMGTCSKCEKEFPQGELEDGACEDCRTDAKAATDMVAEGAPEPDVEPAAGIVVPESVAEELKMYYFDPPEPGPLEDPAANVGDAIAAAADMAIAKARGAIYYFSL
jgi:hypothetical protein